MTPLLTLLITFHKNMIYTVHTSYSQSAMSITALRTQLQYIE